MNGKTNVQIIALATMLAALVLGTARFFAPEFVESLGSSFPELFTGGVIAGIGLLLAADAGIKSLPGTGTDVKSPAVVGVVALVLAALMLSGCAGTRAAYQAAEGLEETAYVVSEHYYALVRELNDLDAKGTLSSSMKSHAQDVVRATREPILELGNMAQAYKAVRSADNETALSDALSKAAISLSRLVNVVKNARNDSASLNRIEPEPRALFAVA